MYVCVCVFVHMYIKNIKFTILTINSLLIFKHGNDTVGCFFFFNLLELQTKNFTDKTT